MNVTDADREASRNCRNAWDRNADDAAAVIAAHREQAVRPLVEALAFYADKDNYECGMGDVCINDYPVMDDWGKLARNALAKARGEAK